MAALAGAVCAVLPLRWHLRVGRADHEALVAHVGALLHLARHRYALYSTFYNLQYFEVRNTLYCIWRFSRTACLFLTWSVQPSVRVQGSFPAHMCVGLVIYFAYGLRHSSEAQLALTVNASDESEPSERERNRAAKASYDAAGRTAPRPTSAAPSNSTRPSHPPT